MSVNYGFDRLRFLAPVPSGARIRGRFKLASVMRRASGKVHVQYDVTVDIENPAKPALIARWLTLLAMEA